MTETIFEVRVPTPLLQYGLDQKQVQSRLTEWLVISLFTEGHISSGKAANLLEMNRVEFIGLLRIRGIAYLNYSPEELAQEFEAIEKLK